MSDNRFQWDAAVEGMKRTKRKFQGRLGLGGDEPLRKQLVERSSTENHGATSDVPD